MVDLHFIVKFVEKKGFTSSRIHIRTEYLKIQDEITVLPSESIIHSDSLF